MKHAETNNNVLEWKLENEAAAISGAIGVGLETVKDDEAAAIFTHLGEQGVVGYMTSGDFGYARLLPGKDSGLTTIATVGDRNPAVASYPELRQMPHYVANLDAIFLPEEALSCTQLLAAILLHEGAHRRDLNSPEHRAEATSLFPNVAADEAERLLTEVKAFELEGKLLDNLMGADYASYIQSEIEDADERAIRDQDANGGLLIEAGIDRSVTEAAVAEIVTFLNPKAREFYLDMLAMAMPLHVGLRVVDRICDRNQVNDEQRAAFKATLVGANSEYLY